MSAWINALNSGNYQQAAGAMCEHSQSTVVTTDSETRDDGTVITVERKTITAKDAYCCLGVLADVMSKQPIEDAHLWAFTGREQDAPTNDPIKLGTNGGFTTTGNLTSSGQDAVGLPDGATGVLISLNDDGVGFEQIARVVKDITRMGVAEAVLNVLRSDSDEALVLRIEKLTAEIGG